MSRHFDTIVIGAGQAGPFLAVKLAANDEQVAVIERRQLGGTCVNRGCTPTKTLRKSARVAYLARRAAEFGVNTGPVVVDFAAAMDRMQARVDASRKGLESWLGGLDKLTVIQGDARIDGRADGGQFQVVVGDDTHTCDRLVLNTGTSPFVPPVPGLREAALTNESLLQLRERPAHLIVLGGSYIGLEMGQIFRRLGCEVSIIEAGERIAGREDEDISADLLAMLTDEGIAIHAGSALESVDKDGDGVVARLSNGDTIRGSHMLAATGRSPNTKGLGLDTIGVETDARGYITTNAQLETEVANVYALGDINRRGAFTHTSYHDHEIVAANIAAAAAAGKGTAELRSADDRTMAYAMFTDPPLGHVGIYERDAQELVNAGRKISQAVFTMSNVSRAKEEGELIGRIKLIVDEESGAFLGATMLGIQADEIIQAISLVMASGGTWKQVRDALPVHPTVTEFLPTILDRREPMKPE